MSIPILLGFEFLTLLLLGGGGVVKRCFLCNSDPVVGECFKKKFFLGECRLCVYGWLGLLTILLMSTKWYWLVDYFPL